MSSLAATSLGPVASTYALTTVEVERFRSFRRATVELNGLTVLVGPNGAGKSNFLELFDMVGAILGQQLGRWVGQRGGADRILHNGLKQSSNMRLRLEYADGAQGYEATLEAASGGGLFFADEKAWGTGAGYDTPYFEHLGSGHAETKLHHEVAEHPGGVCAWTVECLSGWQRYHFHDTSESAGVKQPGPIGDNRTLRRDGANLAAFLYRLQMQQDPAVARIRDALQSVAPFFEDFVLQPQAANDDTIKLEWRHRDSDIYGDASTLSDGSLRFLCLATVLLQPDPPKVILIDEPELGLHPFAIYQLADLLDTAARRVQVIVSTQSVTLLDRVNLASVITAERVDGETRLAPVDADSLDEWMEEFSVGDLWLKNIIGARPKSA